MGIVEEVDEEESSGKEASRYRISLERAGLVFEEGEFRIVMSVGGKEVRTEI